MCKEMCAKCPWRVEHEISEKWSKYVEYHVKSSNKKTVVHRCHTKDEDTWGKPTKDNVCVGSMNRHKEKMQNREIPKKSWKDKITNFKISTKTLILNK